MTKYERLQGLKPRGVRTTDDAWAKLKGWCQRLKVTLEEGLDKLLMGLDDFEGGADDRKPAKVGRPADARLVEKYKEGQEKLEADKQAFAAEYVLAPEPVETAEPKPPYKDNRIGDVTYQGTAGVESAPTPDLTQPETSIIEPEAAAEIIEEPGWGVSSGQPGLGAEVAEEEPMRYKLNTKKLQLGLEGRYEEPLWKVGEKWEDSDGVELRADLAKALDKSVKAGKMSLEVMK